MESLGFLWSIEESLFTIWGYPMSTIELVGTSFGLISVWLATRANIHTWTTGIVNIVAFFIIYHQIQLYSDMLLQLFFFVMSIVGIWQWMKKKSVKRDKKVTLLKRKYQWIVAAILIVSTIILGSVMSDIHYYLSEYFSKPASYPYADAFTTVLSIAATFLMAYKKIECWVLWILVDVVCVFLYFQKGVLFISLEYFIFLLLASSGFISWVKSFQYAQRISAG